MGLATNSQWFSVCSDLCCSTRTGYRLCFLLTTGRKKPTTNSSRISGFIHFLFGQKLKIRVIAHSPLFNFIQSAGFSRIFEWFPDCSLRSLTLRVIASTAQVKRKGFWHMRSHFHSQQRERWYACLVSLVHSFQWMETVRMGIWVFTTSWTQPKFMSVSNDLTFLLINIIIQSVIRFLFVYMSLSMILLLYAISIALQPKFLGFPVRSIQTIAFDSDV